VVSSSYSQLGDEAVGLIFHWVTNSLSVNLLAHIGPIVGPLGPGKDTDTNTDRGNEGQ